MPPTMRATKKARSTETVQPEASLHVEAPPSFDLGLAISSYGFFMLPPNQWVKAAPPSKGGFRRPLSLPNAEPVTVKITQGTKGARTMLKIGVESPTEISEADRISLRDQVIRMLRLRPSDIDQVEAFQSMHAEAKRENFGYMFRSPSLWEDMVKSITLCNCGWGRTISMNAALCNEVGNGAFPTPQQVLDAGPEALQSKCGVGYRAKTICALAQQVLDGKVDVLEAESSSLSAAELYKKVLPFSGMGPFTAANVLQLLGHFERIAADSETLRHLKQFHNPPGLTPKNLQEVAQKVYKQYHPYQYLAYWYEMRRTYEDLFGCLTEMDPQDYARATGHIMRTCSAGVVRPLSSPASQPSQAVAPSTSSPLSSAAATVSKEPLIGNTFGVEGLPQDEDMLLSGVSTAMGGCEADDNYQSQLPAAIRTRRTRKAAKTAIDAALQTLADVQAEAGGPGEAQAAGSMRLPNEAMLKEALQQRLKAQPAARQGRSRQSKRSLARETLKSPELTARKTMGTSAAGQRTVNEDGDLMSKNVVLAPVTPEYQLRSRQRRIQH